jgi:hypothetical protein
MTEPGEHTSLAFLKDGAKYPEVGRGVRIAECRTKNETAVDLKENVRNR